MTGRLKNGGRAVLVAAVLSMLAACAQTTQRSAGNGPYYNRPDSTSPPGPPSDPWGPWIRDASRRFDVPEGWIREVMRQESGGRANATSPVGAMGLMQVMPGTYRELQARYNLGSDPYHPYDSIQAGAAYLREMYESTATPPSSPPTMPDRGGSRTTCGVAAACRTRRATMSPASGHASRASIRTVAPRPRCTPRPISARASRRVRGR